MGEQYPKKVDVINKVISLIIIMLFNTFVPIAMANDSFELFDVNKGEVVSSTDNSLSLQTVVKNWIFSAIGVNSSFEIEPPNGIAVKIKLTPPIQVQSKWMTGIVSEVVLFVSESNSYLPTLLIIRKGENPLALHLRGEEVRSFLNNNNINSEKLNLEDSLADY